MKLSGAAATTMTGSSPVYSLNWVKGTIDWQGINRILHEIDFDGWGTVEQDILPEKMDIDALASAKGNRAFLRAELGW